MSTKEAQAIISELVAAVIKRSAPPIRLLVKDIPRINYHSVIDTLGGLLQQGLPLHVAVIPDCPTPEELRTERERLCQHARTAGFALGDNFVCSVEEAEHWRNTLPLSAAIVVFAPSEHAKLTSFDDFYQLTSSKLKGQLCEHEIQRLQNEPGGNEVQPRWWKILKESPRVSLGNLLDYYVNLRSLPYQEYVKEAAKQIHRLGLLPDPHLFDYPKEKDILRRLELNWEFVGKITELTESDRKKIAETLRLVDNPEARARLQRTFRLIRGLYESNGQGFAQLTLDDVIELWRWRPAAARLARTSQSQLDQRVLRALLSGTDESDFLQDLLAEAQKKLTGVNISLPLDDPRPKEFRLQDQDSTAKVVFTVDPAIVAVCSALFTETRLGGLIESDVPHLAEALRKLTPDSLRLEWTRTEVEEYLEYMHEVEAGAHLHHAYRDYMDKRAALVPSIPLLCSSPLLLLAQDEYLHQVNNYIESFATFLSLLNRAYGVLFEEYGEDVRELFARVLEIDTIVVKHPRGFSGLLGPLHPLYLWHYAELCRLVKTQVDRLDDMEKELILNTSLRLPNFLSNLCITNRITGSGTRVLTAQGRIGPLPHYEESAGRLHSSDGMETVAEWLRQFVQLYRHARYGLRVALVGPRSLGQELLKCICDLADEGTIQGAHVTVLTTEGKGQELFTAELSHDDEERIGERFRGVGRERAFTLEVLTAAEDWVAQVRELDLPMHVLLVFDRTPGATQRSRTSEQAIQPLYQPRKFQYRMNTKQVELVPAPGGLFKAYYDVAVQLDQNAHPSYVATHQDQAFREQLGHLAGVAPWVIIADRHVDRDLKFGMLRVATAREGARQLAAFTDQAGRFRRILRDVVTRYNTAVTDGELDGLLEELSNLLDQGLIHLGSNDESARVKGLLGTLIVARWYKKQAENAMVVSLDSEESRRWLRLRSDGHRADLLGVVLAEDSVRLDVIEVKTIDNGNAEFQIDGDWISGPAIDQLLATESTLREVFASASERENELLVTPARREVLREHFYREISKAIYSSDQRKTWSKILDRLFDGELAVDIRLNLAMVLIGQTVDQPIRQFKTVGQPQTPVRLVQLNEQLVEVLAPHPSEQSVTYGQEGEATPLSPRTDDSEKESQGKGPGKGEGTSDGENQLSVTPGKGTDDSTEPIQSTGQHSSSHLGPTELPRVFIGKGMRGATAVQAWFEPHRPDNPLPNPHIIITGATGTGKTQAIKSILLQLRRAGFPTLILDFKDDYSGRDYAKVEHLEVYDVAANGLPFNPLALPPDPHSGTVNAISHIYKIAGILQRVFGLGVQQENRLREAMKQVYLSKGIPLHPVVPSGPIAIPPFRDVLKALQEMKGTDELVGRISPLFDLQLFRAEAGSLEDLFESAATVRLSQLPSDEVKNVVAEFLLMGLYNHLIQRPQPHRLSRTLVLDEAWRIANSPYLEPLMREGRAFGLGVIIATQFASDLRDVILGSAATKLYFATTENDHIRHIVKALLGRTTGTEAERLAALIKDLPPFHCLLQSLHFSPFLRVRVQPYIEHQDN
ncbi:hypothetical protein caldi_06000 [Caldinitratiruptor microaerophilus]|uniref:AAA+ ATPase domain-containing protein n=1 Tax=Caldinitratiruptor microaerophilus TaxID=671077 RepID=A0AA35G772_9FIRM|nr:hypothetical protein caldi_06000 [Caldinitratiruptor microaerophilus]